MVYYTSYGKVKLSNEFIKKFEEDFGLSMCTEWARQALKSLPLGEKSPQKEIETKIREIGKEFYDTQKDFQRASREGKINFDNPLKIVARKDGTMYYADAQGNYKYELK